MRTEEDICKECIDWIRKINFLNYKDYMLGWRSLLDEFRINYSNPEESLASKLEFASYAVKLNEDGTKNLIKFRRELRVSDNFTIEVVISNRSEKDYLVLIYL